MILIRPLTHFHMKQSDFEKRLVAFEMYTGYYLNFILHTSKFYKGPGPLRFTFIGSQELAPTPLPPPLDRPLSITHEVTTSKQPSSSNYLNK